MPTLSSSQVDISRLTDEWRLKIMYQHLSFAMFRSFHHISRHSSVLDTLWCEFWIFSFSMFIGSSNPDSNNNNNNFSVSSQQIKKKTEFLSNCVGFRQSVIVPLHPAHLSLPFRHTKNVLLLNYEGNGWCRVTPVLRIENCSLLIHHQVSVSANVKVKELTQVCVLYCQC